MRRPALLAPPDRPAPRARIPGAALRVALAGAGAGLSLVAERSPALLTISFALAIAAAVAPRHLWAWGLVVVLALSQLANRPGLTWRFLVLLAGIHLLHVLGMLAAEVPGRSFLDPGVLVRPVVRFVLVEVPIQAVAAVALVLLSPGVHGHRPVTVGAFAAVGVVALAGLGLLLWPRVVAD